MSDPVTSQMDVLIVSGLSGSGKSVTIRSLEDIGFFCVDNLPIDLLEDLVQMLAEGRSRFDRVALVMDTRDPHLIEQGKPTFQRLRDKGLRVRILYLESSDAILVRRFKETRRKHPLAADGGIPQGILEERKLLEPLRELANIRIDTSEFNVHQLRAWVQDVFVPEGQTIKFNLAFLSFGFKYGLPSDADLIFDVRFLPNPHYIDALRSKRGTDAQVADYVLGFEQTVQFLRRLEEMLQFLLPFYRKEGKHYLTLAVGCTGGKHRSVAVAEALAKRFNDSTLAVYLHHRDIRKTD